MDRFQGHLCVSCVCVSVSVCVGGVCVLRGRVGRGLRVHDKDQEAQRGEGVLRNPSLWCP